MSSKVAAEQLFNISVRFNSQHVSKSQASNFLNN